MSQIVKIKICDCQKVCSISPYRLESTGVIFITKTQTWSYYNNFELIFPQKQISFKFDCQRQYDSISLNSSKWWDLKLINQG